MVFDPRMMPPPPSTPGQGETFVFGVHSGSASAPVNGSSVSRRSSINGHGLGSTRDQRDRERERERERERRRRSQARSVLWMWWSRECS